MGSTTTEHVGRKKQGEETDRTGDNEEKGARPPRHQQKPQQPKEHRRPRAQGPPFAPLKTGNGSRRLAGRLTVRWGGDGGGLLEARPAGHGSTTCALRPPGRRWRGGMLRWRRAYTPSGPPLPSPSPPSPSPSFSPRPSSTRQSRVCVQQQPDRPGGRLWPAVATPVLQGRAVDSTAGAPSHRRVGARRRRARHAPPRPRGARGPSPARRAGVLTAWLPG